MTDDDDLEHRLGHWLRHSVGIEGPRRIIRISDGRILVTKVPPGFSATLLETAYGLPRLVDAAALKIAYNEVVSAGEPRRVTAWRQAVVRLLERLPTELAPLVEDILIGIESEEALLETIFWTDPRTEGAYSPAQGEREAYRDVVQKMAAENDLFTRRYGTFEGREVVNHCPAAPLARTMLAQAWELIGGEPVPGP